MVNTPSERIVRFGKPLVFLLCLTPLGVLAYSVLSGQIGPNPVEAVTHFTGEWALRLLLITLAVTPLRRLTGRVWLMRFRRMTGLFAFFYASLHLLTYLWLDRFFDLPGIVDDVIERPYITLGFTAFLLMVPLAATSTRGMMRRLGRRWQALHRAVYAIGLLSVLHFLWLVKADVTEPAVYGLVLAALLLFRVPFDRFIAAIRRGLSDPAASLDRP